MAAAPAVDLVLATVGRETELERLLTSLATQTLGEFRVLVVDQNEQGRLDALLARYEGALELVRLRAERGLSRARNAALPHVRADLVGFPDDDCWYPGDLIERLVDTFRSQPEWAGVTCVTLDERGSRAGLRWDRDPGPLTRQNLFRRTISPGVFLRRRVVEALGPFDETLGVGAGTPYGSGEEADYILRALDRGLSVVYQPQLAVYHPGPDPAVGDRGAMTVAYRYGVGHTELLLRHGYSRRFAAWRGLQLLLGAPVFLLGGRPGRTRYYSAMARGRLRGLLRGV